MPSCRRATTAIPRDRLVLGRNFTVSWAIEQLPSGRAFFIRTLEARGGIEPPIKVLQTFALPLGDRATITSIRIITSHPSINFIKFLPSQGIRVRHSLRGRDVSAKLTLKALKKSRLIRYELHPNECKHSGLARILR
jgi:hypothetical protein